MILDDNIHLSKFSEHISFIQEKVDQRRAYLGVMAGSAVFFFSLFLSWSQARSTTNLQDSGYSSGWSEGGIWSFFPLLIVLYFVIKDKKIGPNQLVLISALSLIILLYNNVLNRSVWVVKEYKEMTSDFGTSWKDFSGVSHNAGSDLGSGFWLGLIGILTIETCGMAWSFHKLSVGKTLLGKDISSLESPSSTEDQRDPS